MTSIALFGAGGKMGYRLASNLKGSRFDVRRFHDAVLQNGAVPLPVLERQIERFLEEEKARPAR